MRPMYKPTLAPWDEIWVTLRVLAIEKMNVADVQANVTTTAIRPTK